MNNYDSEIEEKYNKLPESVNRHSYDNGKLRFADYFSCPPMFFANDLSSVPCINRYNGGHAFLIAGGPSFKNIDVKLLAQPGILTLGINNSPASFRPNLWTCVDTPANFLASIWLDPTIEKIVPISHQEKTLYDSSKDQEIKVKVKDCPNVIYYRRNEVFNPDQYLFEDKLNWGDHSEIGGNRTVLLPALRIAFLLGIRHLYLLGVDFHMDKNSKYHFEQDRSKGSIKGNMETYEKTRKRFDQLKEIFKQVGFEVYNCYKESSLKAFPYMPFEEAIENALSSMPKVNLERTAGMYDRIAKMKKEEEVKKAEREAAKYTQKEKDDIQQQLNQLREDLSDAKEEKNILLCEKFPELSEEIYLWAHKLKKPKSPELLMLYDKLDSGGPSGDFEKKLFEIQKDIEESRDRFRKCEKLKNKIHGIVKK